MAALQDEPCFGAASLASPFGDETVNRTAALQRLFPGDAGHELATWGARVERVGVNPRRRAVVAVGVLGSHPGDPWPVEARLTGPRKRLGHPACGGLPSHRAPGTGRLEGVLVDRLGCRSRQEARGTRAPANSWSPSGLAPSLFGAGREHVSEAERAVAKPRLGGGPAARLRARARSGAPGPVGGRRSRIAEARCVGAQLAEAVLAPFEALGLGRDRRSERQGAPSGAASGSRAVDKAAASCGSAAFGRSSGPCGVR